MSELSDIMGDDFASEYEQASERRRERVRKVQKETLMEIAYKAIKGGGFKGEEPRFSFQDEDISHEVLLMESPEQDMQKFRHEMSSGAISLGMFHMGDLMSCVFNEDMLEALRKIDEDEYYLVVGRYTEKTETKDGEERHYKNIAPVRGIIPLHVAKKFAENYENKMQESSVEEQASAQQSSSSSSSDSSGGMDLGGLDSSDESYDRESIIKVFQTVGQKAKEVLEGVTQNDTDSIETVVDLVDRNVDNAPDRETILDIFEEEVAEIEGRGEEEEDDDLDLGGLGSGTEDEGTEDTSDEDDVDMGSVTEDSAEPDDESEEDSDDGESDVADWF